jgi:hypothetical protein
MTCLRVISGIVINPNFHRPYIIKYNELEPKLLTIGTSVCLLSVSKISFSEISYKKNID